MKNVTIGGQKWAVKTAWSECGQADFNQLLPLQLVSQDPADPAAAGRLKQLALTALMPGLDTLEGDLTDADWFRLGRLTDWIWATKVRAKPFTSFLLKGPSGPAVTFLLPDDNFSNTTAIEIAMANIHYLAFTRPKNPNPKAVFNLVATLCRPYRKDLAKFRKSADWNGDQRLEYNTIIADEWAAAFALLPLGTIMAITQYFEAMNDRFLAQYKAVYAEDPNADQDEPLYHNGEGLVTTLMDIAGVGVFGDFANVCKQNGHTVWLYLKDNNLKVRRANKRAAKQD